MANQLTLEAAERIVAAAKKKAAEINTKMDIAVVDAGGESQSLCAHGWRLAGQHRHRAAQSAHRSLVRHDTGEIGKLSPPGGPLFGIEHSNGGLITFPGGVSLKNPAGEVVGAIGVSGSTVENDHAVAMTGAAALGE